jgi:hypothetical protein
MSGKSRRTIRFNDEGRRFNARVAGLALRDGHLLIHRAVHEPFWTIPGGTAELGEDSRATLVGKCRRSSASRSASGGWCSWWRTSSTSKVAPGTRSVGIT